MQRLTATSIFPSFYILFTNPVLKLFPDTTRADLSILGHLWLCNCRCSYTAIYKGIGIEFPYETFNSSLKRCTTKDLITRVETNKSTVYQITDTGIDLLVRFNAALHNMALEQFAKYRH